MTKAKYTPEERKQIKAENLRKNREAAAAKGYTQKSAAREEAIKEGKKVYISNTPCKTCGSCEKYVSSYGCVPCNTKKGLEKLNNKELMEPYRTKEKQAKNRERRRETLRENNKKYSQTERGKAINAEKTRRRYARLKQNIPINITNDELREIQDIYQKAQKLMKETGIQYDVDHIIPLWEGGFHHPANLQIITHEEHLVKTAIENSRRQSK